MAVDENDRGGESIYDFVFARFEYYRANNPEIAKAVDEFCGGAGRNELATVMFPIFYALLNLDEDGMPIPCISEDSAQRAKDELREAKKDVLERPEFEEFRDAVRPFVIFLDISVRAEEPNRKARLLFATILRMIQIEKAKLAGRQ